MIEKRKLILIRKKDFMKTIILTLFLILVTNTFLRSANSAEVKDTLVIVTQNYSNNTADSTVLINIDYPQIENPASDSIITKVNKFLEDEFKQTIAWFNETIVDSFYLEQNSSMIPFTYETGYQVEYNSKDFLSLTLNHYQYTGGAHGNYFAVGYNIDLEDGSVLTLNDILIDGSTDILTYECEESILESYQANSLMEAGLFENEISLTLDQDFYLIPGAIVLQFDPYEIGPYSMGEIIAEISFEKILDILKEDLPFQTK